MRVTDQSTLDVGATVPAATLHCMKPSRNAASTAASMIPMETITPSAPVAGRKPVEPATASTPMSPDINRNASLSSPIFFALCRTQVMRE
ncbi:hypothetical protein [Burkholderia sp. GS2Y]|uniref:Uncharacterized protein n=1 Tax=Burkholderia theae TaxID=3143496 RepID=A0ABU9WI87_9BURK